MTKMQFTTPTEMAQCDFQYPILTEMALAIGTDPVATASLLSLSDEILVIFTF